MNIPLDRIEHYYNLDGSPFATLTIYLVSELYEPNIAESIYLRIDKRRDQENKVEYFLNLTQYAKVRKSDRAKVKKLEILGKLRGVFREASTGSPLNFGEPKKRGINESEIAVLFFNQKTNSANNIPKYLPDIIAKFCDGIKRSDIYCSGKTEVL
jgi:hypothetical protein